VVAKALHSSASVEWSTPAAFFEALDLEFDFALDAAATDENAKAYCYFTEAMDGLREDWTGYGGSVWLNPPYGRGIGKWIAKAAETAAQGTTVVCLLPSRTDTRYFHKYIWDAPTRLPRPGVEVRFLPGRLKFGGSKHPAPFPSVVVVFRPPPVSP
jgi:phage N-6-adenine-methyltransferase